MQRSDLRERDVHDSLLSKRRTYEIILWICVSIPSSTLSTNYKPFPDD